MTDQAERHQLVWISGRREGRGRLIRVCPQLHLSALVLRGVVAGDTVGIAQRCTTQVVASSTVSVDHCRPTALWNIVTCNAGAAACYHEASAVRMTRSAISSFLVG